MMKVVKIALLGLGTVGGGTYRILQSRHDKIMAEYGVDIRVAHILEKDLSKAQALGIDLSIVSTDINNVLQDKEISIVAEFFGGIEPARTFLLKSLEAGKSIVTANKELFSKHWAELEAAAVKGDAGLYFEASCVGGVPIIRVLHESMQGNDVLSLKGIVNGTTNYILTKMSDENSDYASALAEAQRLGYAEFNPTADVDGFDSMYKLSILSTLAFKKRVPVTAVFREGITRVTATDIACAAQLGYAIKLLAISKNIGGRVEARVHPTLIPVNHPLAAVKGSFNAVYITGDNVDDIMMYGRGAGDLPTGSAIVSDIVYAATRGIKVRYPQLSRESEVDNDFETAYFIRLCVQNKKGVMAEITSTLAANNISISQILQNDSHDTASVVFITDNTAESNMQKSIQALSALSSVLSVDSVIRVEK